MESGDHGPATAIVARDGSSSRRAAVFASSSVMSWINPGRRTS